MRRRKIDIDLEKNICIAFIISSDFCNDVIPIYNENYIRSEYIREVISWCVEFHAEFIEAPKLHIQDIYRAKKDKIDDEHADLLEDFLSELSDNFLDVTSFNVEFLKEQTFSYFKQRALKILITDVGIHLKNKDQKAAEDLFNSFSLPDKDLDDKMETDLFNDMEAMQEAFKESAELLFIFRGAFGDMTNDLYCKGNLVGIMAPEKRGKTFMLVMLLLKALAWGNNVAFFGAGDMSRNQMIKRILISICGISDKKKYCGDVKVPVSAEYIEESEEGGENYLDVEYKNEHIKKPLNWKWAWKKAQSFKKLMRRGKFRIACYPTDSLTVGMMKSKLRQWKRDHGFEPALILCDYADIFAPEVGSGEFRHQQNTTWKAFRNLSLSTEFGQPLVIVPTQTDAASYEKDTVKRSNFSEDKRKYAHVSGMLGINQTEEEKEQQVARINIVLMREGDFKESVCCTILQCLSKGKFLLQSFWKSTEENNK